MSNLSDLASWALRGVAGGAANAEGDGGDDQGDQQPMETLSPEEMRAQRLARMEAAQRQQQAQSSANNNDSPKPMEIEKPTPKQESPQKMDIDGEESNSGRNPKSAAPVGSPPKENKSKKAKESHVSADPAKKAQKKAELMLKKVLSISLAGTTTTSDSSCVVIKIDDTAITVQSISEILAERLSLSANDPALRTMPAQKGLIP